jgi:uncharacterized protein DUF4125
MGKDIIDRILEIEKKMFLTVKSKEEAPCQRDIESFLLHRRAQFTPWNSEVLFSYLHDLELAAQQGNNLMTLKYARMENKIPILNTNPSIDKIVVISRNWQKEMIEKFPSIMNGARSLDEEEYSGMVSYLTYLKAELETYSDNTINLLCKLILSKKNQSINMSEEVYQHLVTEMGYESIADAESIMQKKYKII